MKLLNEYGFDFADSALISTALAHSSYAYENKVESYERLEYLGDAVLEVVCTEYLFRQTTYKEGEMSRRRSLYVCENALYEYAKDINLSSYIKMGNGIKYANKTVIADVFEALIAVIYLEEGINKVKKLFNALIVPYIEKDVDFLKDYKSILQENVQTEQKSVHYDVISETGPAHKKHFKVSVLIDNILYGIGEGNSKKEAEQMAAKNALSKATNK